MQKNDCECGIDEAGRGPVLGPLVISMVCGSSSRLKELGARDSKMLSPSQRTKLYALIMETASAVEIIVIDVPMLNREMKSITLNEIEFNAAKALISKATCSVYVDSFDVDEKRLSDRLQKSCDFPVRAEHKADAKYPSVSAASIISKVTRDSKISEISKEYGKVGSGYPSDPVTVGFLRESIAKQRDLSKIVRVEWETWKRLLAEHSQGTLF